MEDSFFVTDTEEMSRAFDPQNLDAPAPGVSPASPIRKSVPSHPVCPFCGTINESPGAPCRQCGMENSQATRAATRAKLGPWYVWQTKNPAAPGMNFATLLNLVERGRVTPRSIVRGPTTHQLWRYAARVKGLSREFGSCWGCGADVTRTSRVCPACKRLQQPPINPDVLLEVADAAQTAPVTSAPAPVAPAQVAPPRQTPDPPPPGPSSGRPAPVEAHAQTPYEAPFAPAPQPARPAPARPVVDRSFMLTPPSSLPVVDMGDAPLGDGMELAAFNLPREYAPSSRPVGRRVLKGIGLAFLLAAISAGVTVYFYPNLAPQYSGIMHAAVAKIAKLFHADDKPARPQQSTGTVPVTNVSQDSAAGAQVGVVRAGGTGQATAARPEPAPPAAPVSPPEPKRPIPQESVIISPAEMDSAVAVKNAWDWHSAAISAEQRDDYATAVKHYEAILNLHLPDGVGPTDVQSRLANARRLLPAGK